MTLAREGYDLLPLSIDTLKSVLQRFFHVWTSFFFSPKLTHGCRIFDIYSSEECFRHGTLVHLTSLTWVFVKLHQELTLLLEMITILTLNGRRTSMEDNL